MMLVLTRSTLDVTIRLVNSQKLDIDFFFYILCINFRWLILKINNKNICILLKEAEYLYSIFLSITIHKQIFISWFENFSLVIFMIFFYKNENIIDIKLSNELYYITKIYIYFKQLFQPLML